MRLFISSPACEHCGAELAEVLEAMQAAPQHRYQVLTKRAGRMRDWCAGHPDLLGSHL